MIKIKLSNIILIILLMSVGWGCSQSLSGYQYLASSSNLPNTDGTSDILSSELNFGGLDSIDNITGNSLILNWAHIPGAKMYTIYNTTSGSAVYVDDLLAPISNYKITGLDLTTNYSFRVNLLDIEFLVDDNTKDVSAMTTSLISTFNGWTHVKSVGLTTPIARTELIAKPASITLSFEAMTVSAGTIESYNVYRAINSGAHDFNDPHATGVNISTRTYTDTSISTETAYYYIIAPVVSGVVVIPNATDDQEIIVYSPPNNMALVHRWAANREMCELMEKTPDRTNNYRCTHTGIGSSDGAYFDIGDSLLIDMFELGCNYTRPDSGTPADSCGDGVNGCLGLLEPDGQLIGNENDIFYNRASSTCYINTSTGLGTTWTEANSSSLNASQRAIIASNRPGLPPLTYIDQNRSQDTCNAFSVTGSGNKSILKRSEFVIASAWSSLKEDGFLMDDGTINDIEDGTSLPSTGHCNTNNGSGLTYDGQTTPANLETLPSTLTHSAEKVITGSTATKNCVSRYGIQDMVGNVWEWNSDQIDDGVGVNAIANTADNTNDDFSGLTFDNNVAPDAEGSFTSTYLGDRDQLRILFPLGIPVVDDNIFTENDGSVSWSTTENIERFHNDYLWLNTSGLRAARSGGDWIEGNDVGRFSLRLSYDPTYSIYNLGCRCRALSPL